MTWHARLMTWTTLPYTLEQLTRTFLDVLDKGGTIASMGIA